MSIARHARQPFRRRGTPGSVPGAVIDAPGAGPSRIHVMRYTDSDFREAELASDAELDDWLSDESVVWINVDGLGDASLIESLGDRFQLHRLVREDIVHVHQRSKVEDFVSHLFIVARMVTLDGQLTSEQISLIVGPNFVLTFQEARGDCLDPVRQRIREHHGRIRHSGADYLAYALFDAILDGYFPVVGQFGEQLSEIENVLMQRGSNLTINEIHRIRGDLYVLERSIMSHRDAVNALMRETTSLITTETRTYLRDCHDHVIQITDATGICREITSDLRDHYFAQISARQNEITKVLTIMASVFIPLSFVTSLYGMNFDASRSEWNMPELRWTYGYPFALSLMGAIASGLLLFFWKRGWFRNDI